MHDFFNPPKIVVGERETSAGDVLCQLYSGIDAPLIRTSIRVAEMAKYCDNAFHALKVTFANEIGNLCKRMGVDSHDVMSIFCEDKKLNLSAAYLKPGFAFGGSCLPKDLRALAYQAKRFDLESHVLNAILMSNAAQVQLAIQMIVGLGKKRVGFLGMAFKPGTNRPDSTPSSPSMPSGTGCTCSGSAGMSRIGLPLRMCSSCHRSGRGCPSLSWKQCWPAK